jgi:hypothetical protein
MTLVTLNTSSHIITFLKVKIMSIWIILKNIVWTYKECNLCQYWDTQSCIHPLYTKPLNCTIVGHIFVSPLAPIVYVFGAITIQQPTKCESFPHLKVEHQFNVKIVWYICRIFKYIYYDTSKLV